MSISYSRSRSRFFCVGTRVVEISFFIRLCRLNPTSGLRLLNTDELGFGFCWVCVSFFFSSGGWWCVVRGAWCVVPFCLLPSDFCSRSHRPPRETRKFERKLLPRTSFKLQNRVILTRLSRIRRKEKRHTHPVVESNIQTPTQRPTPTAIFIFIFQTSLHMIHILPHPHATCHMARFPCTFLPNYAYNPIAPNGESESGLRK